MPRHVRKGDTVIITAGDHRGRQGKILRVLPDQNKVVVEGINLHKRHVRPTQTNRRGGIVEKELPIHISNVSPVVDGKATRVRFKKEDNGGKLRMAARNDQQIGPALKKGR